MKKQVAMSPVVASLADVAASNVSELFLNQDNTTQS